MAFVSIQFIAFMAVVALLYFAMPMKAKWVVLLVASYVFFAINSEWLVLVLFAQTLATYLFGRWLQTLKDKAKSIPRRDASDDQKALAARLKNQRKHVARLGVLVNVFALLFLKYYNFFADSGNVLLAKLGFSIPNLGLIVPIGLSFYTLQAIAYVADVQRGKVDADSNLFKFMLFMSYFPQILQGPIPRYKDLASQLYEGHRIDYRRMCFGAQLILWGFMKKLVIADRLAIPVNQIFDNYSYYDGTLVFLAAVGYSLQVYADFSGGIDIARGFSQVLGIELTENFRQPFFSRSIEEFWRRWHITLGAFMRDYVFYTLSLSKLFNRLGKRMRKTFGPAVGKKIPPFIASFVAFFLVGFWHGANWTFVVYGIWNAIFIMFGVLWADSLYARMKKALHINEEAHSWALFQMFRSFIIVAIGRYFSRADTVEQAFEMIGNSTVNWWNLSFITNGALVDLGLDVQNWVLLAIMLVILLLVGIVHEKGISIREKLSEQNLVFRWLVYLTALSCVLIFGVYGSGYDAASFIYQQF